MEYEFLVDRLISIGSCSLLSVLFVCSLYVWGSHHDRDHSTTIKRRFLSVFIVMLISPAFVYFTVNKATLEKRTLWELLGLRKEGLVQAFVMPLFLTMILFSGPIYMQSYNGLLKLYTEPMYWVNGAKNLIWLRNHVVAPLAEEFTYRSCMLPILGQCFEPLTAVFVCPLFFGAGHLHHMIEKIRKGENLKRAFLIVSFQFLYTTIFGTYSAYLFIRTGHFASTFIVHAFCNHMGFPDVQELVNYEKRQRRITACVFVAGFVLWCCLLNPLTQPSWYYNDIYA